MFANCNDVQFSLKINCCQSCSYHIAYAVNIEGGFYGTHPGSLHITTLHGSLIFLGGLTPPDPPLFRTLVLTFTLFANILVFFFNFKFGIYIQVTHLCSKSRVVLKVPHSYAEAS